MQNIFNEQEWEQAEKLAAKLLTGALIPLSLYKKTPGGYQSPNVTKIAGIIIAGHHLGFTPFESLEKINVLQNKLTLNSNAYLHLAYKTGEVEELNTKLEGKAIEKKAITIVKRKGITNVFIREFSLQDAIAAKLYDPNFKGKSPWYLYTDRMLIARSQSYAIRDAFADALGSIVYTTEEIENIDQEINNGPKNNN